ncbi:MAG: XrtA-associated exopolysaccharide export protein, Rfer_0658/Tmz1t_3282 family [Rhodospirillaceae bacterium]|nr:XrtA-associated exopolysaccharide export protein, Rfer_0658/Tmz1t_3282 family [Rhodospirillaceae bacterium]
MSGLAIGGMALAVAGCSGLPDAPSSAPPSMEEDSSYIVGPTDQLQIFVWRQPDLSTNVIVRPDGKISVPLIDDLQASGRTPTELAKDIEKVLGEVVQEPRVTVIVSNFVGPFDRQIRVVGEATQPQAVPFRRNMTVLDLMIQVGGLTEFAAGNDSVIVRRSSSGEMSSYRVRLDDLLNDGDVSANAYVLPGDIVIIPQSWF